MDRVSKHKRWLVAGAIWLIVASAAWFVFGTNWGDEKAPRVVLNDGQKDALRSVERRLKLCEQYMRSQGGDVEHDEELRSARRDIAEFVAKGEDHKLKWADTDIRRAYANASKPSTVASLQAQIEETVAIIQLNNGSRRAWKHVEQAQLLLETYAGGASEATPYLVRHESIYAQALARNQAAVAPTRLATVIDKLYDAEEVGGDPRPNLRVHAHTKQARRYYDAYIRSGCSIAVMLNMTEAECDYVSKQVKDPSYVVTVNKDSNHSDPARMLVLVDELVKYIKLAEDDGAFERNDEFVGALTKVRTTFDWAVDHMVRTRMFGLDDYFVTDSLRDVERVVRKIREERGPVRIDEPLPENFAKWIAEYRKANSGSWVSTKDCEFWMVPSAHIGKPAVTAIINGRESCYLKTEFDGRSILAIGK